jgi:hypothetical protein
METQIDYPPAAIMVQTAREWYTNSAQNGSPISAYDAQVLSLFLGGKITDNIGAFVQMTAAKYAGDQSPTPGSWSAGIDNTEFRYADRYVKENGDVVYGAYINNRVLMSDVWNNMGPWQSGWINYFNTMNGAQAPTTFLMGETSQHTEVGVGAYMFLDKTWYAEVGVHKSPTHGPFSFLTASAAPSDTSNGSNGTVIDPSPWVRLAYNKEWGPNGFELGMHSRVTYAHGVIPSGAVFISDYSAPVSTYRDVGLDAQYQYVLDPHYFAAHARVTREMMSNAFGNKNFFNATASNARDNLTETYADITYIYKAKYGAMLQYASATGSNDTGLYTMNANGSPDWQSVTPHIFWAPWQNVRLGAMYTLYTKMGGVSTNNGSLVSSTGAVGPHDFNTGMLYATIVY